MLHIIMSFYINCKREAYTSVLPFVLL